MSDEITYTKENVMIRLGYKEQVTISRDELNVLLHNVENNNNDLITEISSLESVIEDLKDQISELESQIEELENN